MKYRYILLYTIVVLFNFLYFFTSSVNAQTTSLAIWPPLLEALIQPGKTITQIYRLKNLGDDTQITAQITPFTPANELGHVKLGSVPAEPQGRTLLDSFSLQNADLPKQLPATFPLKAGQTQELVLKIKIPDNQPEADHYLTFLFSSHTTGLIGGSGATTQGSIGSNILLTISNDGQPHRSAKIEEFRAYSGSELPEKFGTFSFLDSFSPTSFLLRVKNTGSTRFKAIGQIETKNTFNKSVATIKIREDNILANSIRQLQTAEKPPHLYLGRYTAIASITPQDSQNTITQTIHFFVLPYKLLLILLLLYLFNKGVSFVKKNKALTKTNKST